MLLIVPISYSQNISFQELYNNGEYIDGITYYKGSKFNGVLEFYYDSGALERAITIKMEKKMVLIYIIMKVESSFKRNS